LVVELRRVRLFSCGTVTEAAGPVPPATVYVTGTITCWVTTNWDGCGALLFEFTVPAGLERPASVFDAAISAFRMAAST
jgi:hypothetical protein